MTQLVLVLALIVIGSVVFVAALLRKAPKRCKRKKMRKKRMKRRKHNLAR